MATSIADIVTTARYRLREITPKFWTNAELTNIVIPGIRDMWRDVVNLKQEYYLHIDDEHVSLPASTSELLGVPEDVHKVYLIEARDTSTDSTNAGLEFMPRDYNHPRFRQARSSDAVDPKNAVIYYAITAQGAPVGPPRIYCAPQVTSAVLLSFCYIPTLGDLGFDSPVPIPGEVDNALVAWTVAFARATEREDRAPDPGWLAIYSTEKQNILMALGERQQQEPSYVDALFEDY